MKQEALKASKEAAAPGRSLRHARSVIGVTFVGSLCSSFPSLFSWIFQAAGCQGKPGFVPWAGVAMGGSAPGHNLCHFHHRHCHGFPVGSTGLPPRTSCWKEGSLGFIHLFLQHLLIDGWSWWSCPGSLCHPSVHSGPCRRDQEGTEVALLQGLALSTLLTFPWLQGVMAEPKALPFLLLMLV